MPIRIVNAPIDLKPRISELCRETYEAHCAQRPQDWSPNFFDVAIQPGIDAAFLRINGRVGNTARSLFVAMDGDVLAGYIRLSHLPTDPVAEYFSVSVDDVYVLPEYRRQSVGRALLDHAKSLAAKHDWDVLTATIADWNAPSRALFEELEFITKSHEYAFGPDRPARDIPVLAQSKVMRTSDWIWLTITLFATVFLMVRFLR